MIEELQSIKENKTWSLVTLPKGHRPIGLKWVYKLKHDEKGDIIKHKARLVAKGYVQRHGVELMKFLLQLLGWSLSELYSFLQLN
jgi:hypothetical protein